mmetsp:Transcript_33142/g.74898  ORF Transcript_33142/g.74898 Transcript_33142/m.74898 type:complete len:298 (-) Transcript_33142:1488-2381(-)
MVTSSNAAIRRDVSNVGMDSNLHIATRISASIRLAAGSATDTSLICSRCTDRVVRASASIVSMKACRASTTLNLLWHIFVTKSPVARTDILGLTPSCHMVNLSSVSLSKPARSRPLRKSAYLNRFSAISSTLSLGRSTGTNASAAVASIGDSSSPASGALAGGGALAGAAALAAGVGMLAAANTSRAAMVFSASICCRPASCCKERRRPSKSRRRASGKIFVFRKELKACSRGRRRGAVFLWFSSNSTLERWKAAREIALTNIVKERAAEGPAASAKILLAWCAVKLLVIKLASATN